LLADSNSVWLRVEAFAVSGRIGENLGKALATTAGDNEEFQRAVAALQSGNFPAAEQLFKAVLRARPDHVAALNLLGVVLGRLGRNTDAIASFDRALALAPQAAESWFGRAMTLIAIGRPQDAIASFDRAIAAKPEVAQAHLMRAKLLADLRRDNDALAGVDRLLALAPNLAEAWLARSNILFVLARYDAAFAACERALALKPGLAEAWLARGNVLTELDRCDEALVAYDKAEALSPAPAGAWIGRGNALNKLKRYDEALAAYDKAVSAGSSLAEAWLGRGNVLSELRRYDEALTCFDRALALAPELPEAWLGRGNVFFATKRYDEAAAAYDRALAVKPNLTEACLGRGNVLARRKHHRQAAEAYRDALKLDPHYPFAKGLLLYQQMLCCDWRGTDALIAEIDDDVNAGKLAVEPFVWQSVATSPRSLRLCAELYTASRYPARDTTSFAQTSGGRRKLRIGYSSGELREQATSHLIVGVLECHDRSRFEIYGIDNGWDDGSAMRSRLDAAVDGMIDIRPLSDTAAAAAVRDREIDILVNLNGYFGEHRTQLFAQRSAPLQVGYLGFPGTLGARYMDYIIADAHVIPENDKAYYTEKVVYLPNSYQANDRNKSIATQSFDRADCGLPEQGFVFCSFNSNYKIVPEIFDGWMRILSQVKDSVLWLLEDNPDAASNLRKEAAARGVDAERLVFAVRLPLAEHLARHRVADLFLDTLPCNAHTTASDALWAGLPLLTCLGETFPGRVAASLLHAIGLPELVASSLADYESMAVVFATDPGKLATIKRKLADNRLTTPLFDTARLTQQIEMAYTAIHQRQLAGLAPDHIYISN
jgi:predicted O-linked N-acetylglucosamine transferase (SPINDLY family)